MTCLLLTLKTGVKFNTMMVPTTFRGGACGHLGLVWGAGQYAKFPGTAPYTKPTHPDPLNMTEGLTQFQIAQERDQHQEAL
eukprot:14595512-Ditylum_brightwellii.AAC.1